MKNELTFKAFLSEAIQDTTKKLSIEDAASLIKQHCMASWTQFSAPYHGDEPDFGPVLFRGMKISDKKPIAIDTTQHVRKAAYTYNFVNLAVSNLDSWGRFPKRNQSAICSSNYRSARRYATGEPFLMFPFDGTPVGVAPSDDFWTAFSTHRYVVADTAEYFQDYLREYARDINTMVDRNDWMGVLRIFHEVDKKAKSEGVEQFKKNAIKADDESSVVFGTLIPNYSGDFLASLNSMFDPRSHGFKLTTSGHLPSLENAEMWFSGNAVGIPAPLIDKVVELLN